jgi:transposase
VAVAHSLIVIAYHIISRREPYRELGTNYLERQQPEAAAKEAKRYMRRIEKLGFKVTLEPVSVAADVAA